MDGENFLHRLHFDNDSILNQKVDPIPVVDPEVAGLDRHWNLPVEGQVLAAELICQAGLVDRLQEAWPEGSVNQDRRAEDGLRQAIQLLCGTSALSASPRFKGVGLEILHGGAYRSHLIGRELWLSRQAGTRSFVGWSFEPCLDVFHELVEVGAAVVPGHVVVQVLP